MPFLRTFSQPEALRLWWHREPELSKILQKCFEVHRIAPKGDCSVFRATGDIEELEVAAALCQVAPRTPDPVFGVVLTEDDLRTAGLEIEDEKGNVGIPRIDERHANVVGTQEQFVRLVGRVIMRIWEGENRLRAFSSHAIVGQVAVFSKLPNGEIHAENRAFCEKVLEFAKCHVFIEHENRVEICGQFKDPELIEIRASRTLN